MFLFCLAGRWLGYQGREDETIYLGPGSMELKVRGEEVPGFSRRILSP